VVHVVIHTAAQTILLPVQYVAGLENQMKNVHVPIVATLLGKGCGALAQTPIVKSTENISIQRLKEVPPMFSQSIRNDIMRLEMFLGPSDECQSCGAVFLAHSDGCPNCTLWKQSVRNGTWKVFQWTYLISVIQLFVFKRLMSVISVLIQECGN